jgi:FkbM family methyltransferase
VDLGLNRGRFAMLILERWGCQLYGAEPDPQLFQSLPEDPRLQKVQAAIAPADGTVSFHINTTQCASILFDERGDESSTTVLVPAITLPHFMRMNNLVTVQLLKVDIEGAEVSMFDCTSDSELANIEQISVEFHVFKDPGLAPAVNRIRTRMRALGFYDIDFSLCQMDVLFINLRHFALTYNHRLWCHVVKYCRGARRILSRRLGQREEPSFDLAARARLNRVPPQRSTSMPSQGG